MNDIYTATGIIDVIIAGLATINWYADKLEQSCAVRCRKVDPVYVYPLPKAVALRCKRAPD